MKNFFLLLLLPNIVMAAAEGGHHGAPWSSIFQQGYNLSILLIVIVVYFFPQIKTSLMQKKQNFIIESTKALKIKAAAESDLELLNKKILDLELKSQETISNTKKEAEYLKSQFESETTADVLRQKAEAETQIKAEIIKVQKEIKDKLLTDAMVEFQNEVESDKSEKLQNQLKQNFINNIEAAKV